MAKEKKDLSQGCDFDDESEKNDCWNCCYFLFPIGCMYWDEDVVKLRDSTEKEK